MSNKSVWNFWARFYEYLWVQKVSLAPVRECVIEEITSLVCDLNKEYAILDIGCGTGQILREIDVRFSDAKMSITGIDYSEKMIDVAKMKSLSHFRIKYCHMDVEKIEDLNEQYDFIVCTHSFPYYKNQQKALQDMAALLKYDGRLFLAYASVNNLYDRIVMFFVKLTTGKAHYPSVSKTKNMGTGLMKCLKTIEIKTRVYMPSIYLFVMGRG